MPGTAVMINFNNIVSQWEQLNEDQREYVYDFLERNRHNSRDIPAQLAYSHLTTHLFRGTFQPNPRTIVFDEINIPSPLAEVGPFPPVEVGFRIQDFEFQPIPNNPRPILARNQTLPRNDGIPNISSEDSPFGEWEQKHKKLIK